MNANIVLWYVGTNAFDKIVLHALLFIANFLYLLYEVNMTFTPIYFTMIFQIYLQLLGL